jgi:signal transduction histidine kinase/streptogramin lyase
MRHYGQPDGLPAESIFSLFTDSGGRVWIGSRGGLSWFDGTKFHTYSVSDGLPSALVSAMYEDREGSLWIGTDGSGLVRLKNGKFFALPAVDAAGANSILSIAGDADGSLWFGTRASGLLRYRAGKFTHVGRDRGLTFDSIVSIQDDGAGNFWMSSNKGLFRVQKHELHEVAAAIRPTAHFRHFDTADGMRTQECNGGFQPAGGRASDGTLWFPTMRGVAVVDPTRANLSRKLGSPIIERILTADRSSDLDKPVRVLPGKRSVTFEFTYPEYQNPDSVTFRYLLEGFDHDWVQAEHRRAAYYTNLPPGEYYFKVSACESSVCGPPVQTTMIYVQPALFERKAFWAVAGGLLVGLAVLLYRLRIRRLQTKERQLVKLVEARTRELRESRDQLEIRVQERTDELQQANRMLSEEIEVRREAEVKAESANRVKTDFLNNMSHELRTPINGIMGMADLTLMTRLDEEQSEYLGIIRRSADDLLGIVVNILDFSSAYSDEVTLEEGPFLLPDELQHVCSICKPKALEKGLAFSLDMDERIPQHLVGDAPKLRRVLRALLENAVKFTVSGSVELRLELEKREESAVTICFSVHDTGIGVPLDKQSAIFEAFSQADTSSTRRYGGTGLGLTICNQLVRLLHGRLWMRSEVGKGSVFCFSTPFAIQPLTYNATLGSDARPSASGF